MDPCRPLHAIVREAARRLETAGIPVDEARLDAELLARHALGGWDRARFLAHERDPAPAGFEVDFATLVSRRELREPVAYVLGRTEFWGLDLEVTRDVLVPRPETEAIVEIALELFAGSQGPTLAVDAGTGSGCLAIALAAEFPAARIVATDLSPAALAVARRNAVRHGVADRIAFRKGDLLDAIADATLVVSNPPYVPARDRGSLPVEVRDHEPPLALFGGDDGLDVIRALVAAAATRTGPGAWLVFEIGFGQAEAVRNVLGRTVDARGRPAWGDVTIQADLLGIPRTAVARRL